MHLFNSYDYYLNSPLLVPQWLHVLLPSVQNLLPPLDYTHKLVIAKFHNEDCEINTEVVLLDKVLYNCKGRRNVINDMQM
jgi:hypothetical protein